MYKTSSATILLAFVALLFGLLGVYAFRNMNRGPVTQQREVLRTVVPLASRDLASGRVVTKSDVALVRLTKEQMKQRGIKGMFMSDPTQVIGSRVMSSIDQGKPFHTEQFYPDGFRPNVTDQLKPGQRAVTVLLSTDDALHGYANAGQLVDVIYRHEGEEAAGDNGSEPAYVRRSWHPRYGYHANSGNGGWDYTYADRRARRGDPGYAGMGDAQQPGQFASTTVTLLQGVRVLALENTSVGTDAQDVASSEVRVTLAVTPDQAETLRVVEGQGSLSLTLRNPTDLEKTPINPKTLEELLGVRKPDRRELAVPDKMEVYRGGNVSQLTFDPTHPLAVPYVDTRTRKLEPPTDTDTDVDAESDLPLAPQETRPVSIRH